MSMAWSARRFVKLVLAGAAIAGPAALVGLGVADAQAGLKVRLPGTIQAALGGKEWDPAGDVTLMREVSPGVYEFVAAFPKGSYEYKVAVGGAWTENYGKGGAKDGPNIALVVPADKTIVRFVFDATKKTIQDSINDAAAIKAPATVPAAAAAQAAPAAATVAPVVRHNVRFDNQTIAGAFDVVQQVIDLAPGAATPVHMHGGAELVTVIEGEVTILRETGNVTTVLKVGQTYAVPAGQFIRVSNAGSVKAAFVATFLLPKGATLTTPR